MSEAYDVPEENELELQDEDASLWGLSGQC